MPHYPSMRYGVVDGQLQSERVDSPDEERPDWEPSPHKFRALTVAELMREGHSLAEAERLHARELRRVGHIFAGKKLHEAEELADVIPADEPKQQTPVATDNTPLSELRAVIVRQAGEIKELKAAVQSKQAEMDEMVSKFDRNYGKLKAERDRLKARSKAEEVPAEE